MQNIILGQYYPSESVIHELDPRIKIIATVLYIIGLFFVNDFKGYITSLVFLSLIIIASKIPLKFILKGLKPLVLVIILTLGSNVFMKSGDTIIFKAGVIKITEEGIYQSLFIGTRLLLMIIGTILLTLTTKPIKMTD